ncbi:MAG: ThiF family adenylyltransferase, partial [Silvanigrellaceae bacterium]|nr:ThiF family adenylyltransferase [Silvanigrellaceae bacterium]
MNLNKYSRQIALPFIGIDGQICLFQKKILIIGAGALSHSSSVYLATSGIGDISIIDFDIIEESNLSRQIFFRHEDIGKYKAEILSKYLQNNNKDLNIQFYNMKFTEDIFNSMNTKFDLILNASDNFATRKIINRISLKHNIPWVDIGIFQTKAN